MRIILLVFLFSQYCFPSSKILLINSSNNFSIYAPIIKEKDLISLKEVASCLRAKFEWNPIIQEASLKKDDTLLFMWIDKDRAILDKKELTLSSPPKLISSSVFAPVELVKAFVERLNMELVSYNEKMVFKKNEYFSSLNNRKDGFWHILKEGETLYRISQNYKIPLSSLLSLNKIIDPRFITPGTMLYIPLKEEVSETPVFEEKPKEEFHNKNRIKKIVIDPGHGGKDPGAIGKTGLKEKDVVLKIALQLSNELKKMLPDVDIILTRDGDYYIPLSERTGLANFKKADLFISLHANAAFSKEASGFEVYHLSGVASDKYAERLAESENIVTKRFNENLSLPDIILKDMAQSAFINESIELGLHIQNKVCETLSIKNRGVKAAFFYVLRDAKMPAVLIETGFLSNQGEEEMLKQEKFKQNLVSAIGSAILAYKEEYENKLNKR